MKTAVYTEILHTGHIETYGGISLVRLVVYVRCHKVGSYDTIFHCKIKKKYKKINFATKK